MTLKYTPNIKRKVFFFLSFNLPSFLKQIRDGSVAIALGYGLDDRWWRLGILLFTTASRMALEPTQPPIQWVPGALSLGVKLLGREDDHSPPSSVEVKE
jgi:hypothetical protein